MQLSADGQTLVRVTNNDLEDGVFNIPDGILQIGDVAFCGCTGLTEVIIPESVTHINEGVFFGCTGLTEVIIPGNVKHIGNAAFRGCSSLTKVTIFEGVTRIGDLVFFGCSALIEVSIPESITKIGEVIFAHCSNLRDIVIDTLNMNEYKRIRTLVPEESVHLIKPYPYELCLYGIPAAQQEAIANIEPLIQFPLLENCYLMMLVYQMDENLYQVINQVRLPRQQKQLETYQQELKAALNGYFEATARKHQALAAIDKLTKYTQVTEQAIFDAMSRNTNFFESPENVLRLTETMSRLAVAKKFIQWISGDNTISFNDEDKALLSDGSAIALIRQNADIHLDELPSLEQSVALMP